LFWVQARLEPWERELRHGDKRKEENANSVCSFEKKKRGGIRAKENLESGANDTTEVREGDRGGKE